MGRAVNLDFEEVRRELEVLSGVTGKRFPESFPEKKEKKVKPVSEDEDERFRRLPDPFTWRDVADLWGVGRTKAFKLIKLLESGGLIQMRTREQGSGYTKLTDAKPDADAKLADAKKPRADAKPKTLGKEILGLPFARDISKISVRKAVDYAVEQFAKVGIDLLKEIPHFERNVEALKQKMTFALDIPRDEMPVIEPEDIRQFVKDIQGGFVDIFAPWADLKELRALSHFEKFPEMLGGDKGKLWTSLGQRDGDPFDDQVQARIEMIPVRELKPLQSEIFFDKLVGSLPKFGIPKPGGFLATSAIIIVSEEGFILDGHHRYGQALLTDPGYTPHPGVL